MTSCLCCLCVAGFVWLVGVAPLFAGTFVCPGPGGSDLLTDLPGPGCRPIEADRRGKPSASPTVPGPSLEPPPGEPARPAVPPAKAPAAGSFNATSRAVPVLLVMNPPPGLKEQSPTKPNRGDIAVVELSVSHLPNGAGPEVSSDSHFFGTAEAALRTAVYAAAKAVDYDVRFLRVRLSLPTSIIYRGASIDGPSPGAVWAVAVASAILGDPIRSDICMSGTINMNFEVGPVSGLEDKINGCRALRYRELILPAGQSSFNLTVKGMQHGIKVTEVKTLAEAYLAATGQPLRPAQ